MQVGRPRTFDEDDALERAMEFFWEKGYAGASLSELIAQMGIPRQSLYDTFGNKRELFIRTIEHYKSTQLSQALDLLGRDGSPIDNVRDLVRFFEALASDRRCRGCLVANALVEFAPHDEEIADLLQQTLEALRRSIEVALEGARDRGELRPEKSPLELSHALTNAVIGLAVTGKLRMSAASIRDVYAGTLRMLD